MKTLIKQIARLQNISINMIRISIFIVMAWIGGLKFIPYEADGIVPFVANSPMMSFVYSKAAPEYKAHMNKEGEQISANREWHQENRTYLFARLLGLAIMSIGTLVLLGIFFPEAGIIGDVLAIGMSFVTLSFLITTPEVWVANFGGEHGFPYLAGPGRLVLKDIIMLAGAIACLTQSAQRLTKE